MLIKESGDSGGKPDEHIGISDANNDALDLANAFVGREEDKLGDNSELRTYDLDDDGKMSLEELKVMYKLRNSNTGGIAGSDIPQSLQPSSGDWDDHSVKSIDGDDQKLSLEEITVAVRQPAAFPSHSYNNAEEGNYRNLLLQSSPNSYSFAEISSTDGNMKKIVDVLQIGGDFTQTEFNQRDLDGDGHIDGKELQAAVLLGKTLQADHAGGEQNAPQLSVEDVHARMKLLHPAKFGSFESGVATAYSSTDDHADDKVSAMEIKLAYQMQGASEKMSIETKKNADTARETVNQYLGRDAKIASIAELKTYDFDEDGKISLAELKVIHELKTN
ncbi:unnamed protein product, partial [Amoebophrya sp. A120]|eukprot:GSA120T00005999001.1